MVSRIKDILFKIVFLLLLIPFTHAYTTSELDINVHPSEQTVLVGYNLYNYPINEKNSEICSSWGSENVTCIRLYKLKLPRDEPIPTHDWEDRVSQGFSFNPSGADKVWHDLGIGSSIEIKIDNELEEFRPVAAWDIGARLKTLGGKLSTEMNMDSSSYEILHLNTSKITYITNLKISDKDIVTPKAFLGKFWFPFDRYKTTLLFSSPVTIDLMRIKLSVPDEMILVDQELSSLDYAPDLKFRTKNAVEYYPAQLTNESAIEVHIVYGRVSGFLTFFYIVFIFLIPTFAFIYAVRIYKAYQKKGEEYSKMDFDYFAFVFFVFAIRSFLPYPAYTNFTLFDLVSYFSIVTATICFCIKLSGIRKDPYNQI